MEHPEKIPSEAELRDIVDDASSTAAGVAQKMFAEAVIPAARYIISVVDGTQENIDRTRLVAAQDIVSRVLGRSTGQQNAWDELFQKISK